MHSSILCAKCLSRLDHLSNPPVLGSSDTITSRVRNGYNLPLSAKEITQIDTFLVEGSESLSEHDNAIAEIEGLLLRLKNSRDSFQRRCDSARYLISAPIRRLPLDVLHEIFMLFCVNAAAGSQRRIRKAYHLNMSNKVICPTLELTWVCSFWRTFVQSCPNLWASISVSAAVFKYKPNSFQILLKYLSHSADSSLDFFFVAGTFRDDHQKNQETIEQFLGCSMRWRQAGLWILDGEIVSKSAASLSTKSLESLEGLDIVTPDNSDQGLLLRSFSSCPRLRVVKLAWFSWSGHNADFSCVTSLTLGQFIGKSFAHLLRRLPVLESLSVRKFKLSEDDVDNGSHMSPLTKLSVSFSALQPVAWRSSHLPLLTDVTLILSENSASQELLTLCSVLHDSQCKLKKLQIDDYHYHQSPQAVFDLIASQDSLTHLAISTRHIDPFVEFLKPKEDGSYVNRNFQSLSLQFNSSVTRNTFDALACSICDLIESRCTVLYSANGNPELSGLQVLTLNLVNTNDRLPIIPSSVHNRLSLLKEAGFSFTVSFLN